MLWKAGRFTEKKDHVIEEEMTKSLREFSNIKERRTKNDKQLLGFMKPDTIYTTSNIQKFLEINHTATLQRLKKLSRLGYIRLINERIYKWIKLKDIEEKEDYSGWTFL